MKRSLIALLCVAWVLYPPPPTPPRVKVRSAAMVKDPPGPLMSPKAAAEFTPRYTVTSLLSVQYDLVWDPCPPVFYTKLQVDVYPTYFISNRWLGVTTEIVDYGTNVTLVRSNILTHKWTTNTFRYTTNTFERWSPWQFLTNTMATNITIGSLLGLGQEFTGSVHYFSQDGELPN